MQNPVSLFTWTSSEQGHSSPLSLGERNVTTASQLGLNIMPASSTDNTDVTTTAASRAQTEVSNQWSVFFQVLRATGVDQFSSPVKQLC